MGIDFDSLLAMVREHSFLVLLTAR